MRRFAELIAQLGIDSRRSRARRPLSFAQDRDPLARIPVARTPLKAAASRPLRRRLRPALAAAAGVVLAAVLVSAGAAAVSTPDQVVPPPAGAALAALAKPARYSSLASQRVYFVMPDRYANGDPDNDRGGLTGGPGVTGFDPTGTGWFHGGDLRGLTDRCVDTRTGLARLVDLGFTAVWVTPAVVQQAVQGDSAAYHGYWGRDFTNVEPRLGSNDDFASFTGCAHRLGLKVYLDVVVNHTADVILLAGGTTFRGPDEVPFRDCHGKPFAAADYAGGKRFPCLSRRYQPRQPLLVPGNRSAKRPAWLNDVVRYHNRGDIDFGSCSSLCFEQGDFSGLDDLFTEQPFVVNGLAKVFGDWIRRYRLDGFRVDTAKHVDRAFFKVWVPKIQAAARAAGVPDFQVFGEVTLSDAGELATFTRARRIPNVLDFPLQDALMRFAGGSAGARGISTRLADDDYFRLPDGLAPTPPTFLGNHDMGRAALKIKEQGGGSGAELLARDLLGHSLLYLLRGAPVVYYGDEVGMIGRGGDKAARQDMFPTQVAEWRTEERVGSPPIGSGSSFDLVSHPVSQHLRALGALRGAHPALSTGGSFVRVAQEGLLAVSRIDRAARREYLAVFNASEEPRTITVRTATPNAAWAQLLGPATALATGANGRAAVRVPPLSALLYRAGSDLPKRGAARLALRARADLYTNLVRLTATAGTLDPLDVTFAMRRAGHRSWARVAADDGSPYRAYLDPRELRPGEQVSLVAVARASDGSVSTSPVLTLQPRPRR